jgi:hypothetical protein
MDKDEVISRIHASMTHLESCLLLLKRNSGGGHWRRELPPAPYPSKISKGFGG